MTNYAYSVMLREYMDNSTPATRLAVADALAESVTPLLQAFGIELRAYSDEGDPPGGRRYFTSALEDALTAVVDAVRPALGRLTLQALDESASVADGALTDATRSLAWELRTRLAIRDEFAAEDAKIDGELDTLFTRAAEGPPEPPQWPPLPPPPAGAP